MRHYFAKSAATLAVTALLLASCGSDTETITQQETPAKGRAIGFNVDLSQDWYGTRALTRAAMEHSRPRNITVKSSDGSAAWLQETTVSGIDTPSESLPTRGTPIETVGALGDYSTFCYYADTDAQYYANVAGTNKGTLRTEKTWEEGRPLRFYAVHPYDASTSAFASSASSTSYRFTVSSNVASQADLMYAATGAVAYNESGTAPLHFRHALTAVRFALGSSSAFGGTVTSVTLRNVLTTGTYTLPFDDDGTGEWSGLGGKTDITLSGLSLTTDDHPNNEINGGEKTFLMIPQELTDITAEIAMTLADGSTRTLTAALGSTEANDWQQGTTRTYKLSKSQENWDYVLTVSSPSAIEYTDTQTGAYTITSYRQSEDGSKQQPVAWEITKYEYSDDNGATWTDNGTTMPAWLTALSLGENGAGSTEAASGTATVDAASYITDKKAERDNQLKNAAAKSDYDLSQGGETANCYVISAPGTYKIPLIYGNMRGSDGTINTACLGNTTALQATFVDAFGTNLYTQNKMEIQGVDASTEASLVWSDVSENVVSNLAVDAANDFLTFEVKKDNLEQGNAVVGIKNADGYLWSWHLWFAPEDVLDMIPVTNHQNKTYNFTKENLGFKYTDWNYSNYDTPRQARITVKQENSNEIAQIVIIQNNGLVKKAVNTLYQFGRKDAMPVPETFYPTNGFVKSEGKVDYVTSIKTPGTFYGYNGGAGDWCSTTYKNTWSANNTDTNVNGADVVKTVYDPCPAGFHTPGSDAFTGFTMSGENTTETSEYNVDGSFDKGWHFWTNSDKTETIYFPAMGYYSSSGGWYAYEAIGGYWSAIPHSTDGFSWNLGFRRTNVQPQYRSHRATTFSMRPVKD